MAEEINNIAIIGAGNVSTHLAKALHEAGKNIIQIFSRNPDNARKLAITLSSDHISDISKLTGNADLYIVSVPEKILPDILKIININNKLLVHTSGTANMNILQKNSKNYGVFYPLQTFTKTRKVDFNNIPICIEANNKTNLKTLEKLANSISEKVKHINSEQRLTLHIAAIFACNFSNYLYTIADEILENRGISFELIKPLIQETSEKIKTHKAVDSQTGPAKRNDTKTIETHLRALSKFPEYRDIYETLSKMIINHKTKK